MESSIPLIILSALVFFQIKKFKDMCRHLSAAYPEEWEKLSRNAMGGSKWSVTNANLSESLKTGFFSTVADEKIAKFEKFKSVNIYLMGALVILQIAITFL